MIDCIVLGDSIAVGTHIQRHECKSYAEGGINSFQWNKMYSNAKLSANSVIISLGSNDHQYVKTEKELRTIRQKVRASKVYWILPHGNLKASMVDIEDIRNIIRKIADENGDIVIPITGISRDNIHPTHNGYKEIARVTREQ